MSFPHVRIVNAPAKAAAPIHATQSSMRAFKDADTGLMRGPSMEEMQTMAAEIRSPSTDQPEFYGRNGAIGKNLDESSLQYSVVVRQPDGSLAEVCVQGADKADEIIKSAGSVQVAPRKGARDVR